MTCEVYLLVNRNGTKTKQWVIVADGKVYPEVLTNLEVADRMARLLFLEPSVRTKGRENYRKEKWEEAERALVSEIAASLSVPKCPDGRWWTGAEEIGFKACVRCPHLQTDKDMSQQALVRERLVNRPPWECGLVIQEVRVARRLADR